MSFEITVPGKFVLCGEHAVLRGFPALALPHPRFRLRLRTSNAATLEVQPPSLRDAVRGVFEQAAQIDLKVPSGSRVEIDSDIPVAAGLGSSAALCVALSASLDPSLLQDVRRWNEVATRLEDRFHGTSSGMDIAVCVAREPIEFRRGEAPALLGLSELPKFSFHDSGLPKKTKESVAAVTAAGRSDLDQKMGDATVSAIEGLRTYSLGRKRVGLDAVAQAMTQGMLCFEEWGLVPAQISAQRDRLLQEGALAVKLTGAGGGGYLVALWND